MRTGWFILASLVTFLHSLVSQAAQRNPSIPNVIIVFVDDMGYGDLGCYGATDYATPNIDRLAANGMRFTGFYSGSAVCSPSRATLLTGCFAPRVGVTNVLLPEATIGLNPEEVTIPEMLKNKGYTSAIIGKWHLGDDDSLMPLQHGFDEFYGLPYSNDLWPVHYNGMPVTRENYLKEWKLNCPPLWLFDGAAKVEKVSTLEDQDQLTTKYTNRAVDFIRRKKDQPFFLYLAHNMPHVPLGVSNKFRGKSKAGLYGDVIMEIDWSVGEIMQTLKETGLEENTLVIFTSDNGPWLNYGNHGGSSGGLREGKNSVYEGGFRVPCIMAWPKTIPAGQVCHRMASSIDILPTIAKIVGTEMPRLTIDGISILPLLRGDTAANPRREFYFYIDRALNAVRLDNWKLVLPHVHNSNEGSIVGNDGWPGIFNMVHTPGGLYDLRRDPGERYDVTKANPEIAGKLLEMAQAMRERLGDSLEGVAGKERRAPGRAQ